MQCNPNSMQSQCTATHLHRNKTKPNLTQPPAPQSDPPQTQCTATQIATQFNPTPKQRTPPPADPPPPPSQNPTPSAHLARQPSRAITSPPRPLTLTTHPASKNLPNRQNERQRSVCKPAKAVEQDRSTGPPSVRRAQWVGVLETGALESRVSYGRPGGRGMRNKDGSWLAGWLAFGRLFSKAR